MEIIDANIPFPSTLIDRERPQYGKDTSDDDTGMWSTRMWDADGKMAKVAPAWMEFGCSDEGWEEKRCAAMTVTFDGQTGRAG